LTGPEAFSRIALVMVSSGTRRFSGGDSSRDNQRNPRAK
jgi:hypothetical protein